MNAWTTTTDRSGNRAYCLPTGQVVCKDGTGPLPVTVYYAGFTSWGQGDHGDDHGMTDTVREGKAWAEQEADANAEAETLARVTGSVSATVRTERRQLDGTLEVVSVGTHHRTAQLAALKAHQDAKAEARRVAADVLAQALLASDLDYLDAMHKLFGTIPLLLWQDLCGALELCPVHLCDDRICADDELECQA